MLVLLLDVDSGPLDETEAQDEVMMQKLMAGLQRVLGNVYCQLLYSCNDQSITPNRERKKINHQLFW